MHDTQLQLKVAPPAELVQQLGSRRGGQRAEPAVAERFVAREFR